MADRNMLSKYRIDSDCNLADKYCIQVTTAKELIESLQNKADMYDTNSVIYQKYLEAIDALQPCVNDNIPIAFVVPKRLEI